MKKNKADHSDKAKDPENEGSPQRVEKVKKRSWTATLFKGLAYFFLFIFLLIVGTGVVLEYYFPAEKVRVLAEKEGTKHLKLPLSIKKIKLNLLSGVRIDGVIIGSPSKPLASVQAVILDYDLSQLLQGHLIINQVLVDQPQLNAVSKNGVWNFQPLLNLKDSQNNSASTSSGSTPLPLAKINLQQLNIRNASAVLEMDDQLSAHIIGLNLEAKGKASRDEIDLKLRVLMNPDPNPNILFKKQKEKIHFQSHATTDLNFFANNLKKLNVSGSFGFKQNQIQFGEVLPSPKLEGSLSAEIQLQPERINLSEFSLTLDDRNLVMLSTKVENFSTASEIEANIKKVSFQLADILKWGAKWLPPISGHGKLETENLDIQAKLPGFKPDHLTLKGGPFSTKDLTFEVQRKSSNPNKKILNGNKKPALRVGVDSSDLKIHIEAMDSSLQIREVSFKKGKPEKVSADLKMQLAKGQAQKAEIRNWKQTLTFTAEGSDLSKIKMRFKTDIDSLHYDHPLSKKVNLPFSSEGSLHGNWKKGDLKLQKISYQSGKILKGTLSGELKKKNPFNYKKI